MSLSSSKKVDELARVRGVIMDTELRLDQRCGGDYCPDRVDCDQCPGWSHQSRLCMLIAIKNWLKKPGQGWSP